MGWRSNQKYKTWKAKLLYICISKLNPSRVTVTSNESCSVSRWTGFARRASKSLVSSTWGMDLGLWTLRPWNPLGALSVSSSLRKIAKFKHQLIRKFIEQDSGDDANSNSTTVTVRRGLGNHRMKLYQLCKMNLYNCTSSLQAGAKVDRHTWHTIPSRLRFAGGDTKVVQCDLD